MYTSRAKKKMGNYVRPVSGAILHDKCLRKTPVSGAKLHGKCLGKIVLLGKARFDIKINKNMQIYDLITNHVCFL